MNSEHLQSLFAAAVRELKSHRDELCRIDAETGDGDHGFAIVQIAETILCESLKPAREDTQVYFDDLCLALLRLNKSVGRHDGGDRRGAGSLLDHGGCPANAAGRLGWPGRDQSRQTG